MTVFVTGDSSESFTGLYNLLDLLIWFDLGLKSFSTTLQSSQENHSFCLPGQLVLGHLSVLCIH